MKESIDNNNLEVAYKNKKNTPEIINETHDTMEDAITVKIKEFEGNCNNENVNVSVNQEENNKDITA